jgi:integrase
MKRKDGIYQRKPGGPFYAIYQWEGRRYCESTKTTNKTEAKAFLDRMKVALRRGTYRTPTERQAESARVTTVSTLADRWLKVYIEGSRNPKGRALTSYRVDAYLKPFMGTLPAPSVTKDTLREYRTYLQGLKVPKSDPEVRLLTDLTVAHILSDARCLFTWAHDMGYIGHLPVPKKLLPKRPELEPRGLSDEEQKAVACLSGPHGLAVRIMLGTGVRWSELCRLTSADVVAGELVVQGATKSGKMRRVPVPPALLAELKGHVGKLVPFEPQDDPAFNRSVQRASGVDDFSAHRCRHSYALNYIRRGGNLRVLQLNLGHGTLSTTEIYLRSDQELVREDAKRVAGWSATA